MSAASRQGPARVLAAGLWLLCLGCGDDGAPHAATKAEPLPQQQASPPPTEVRLDPIPSDAAVQAEAAAILDAYKPLPLLRKWPKNRGFPGDLLVDMRHVTVGSRSRTTIRARGAASADIALSRNGRSCTFRVNGRALARFGWRQFVEVIEAGQQRQSDRDCSVADACASRDIKIRAFGRMLSADTVARHRLQDEIEARVDAVMQGYNPWPRKLDEAISRLEAAVSSCLEMATHPMATHPRPAEVSFYADLAIARGSRRARPISIRARGHTRRELACFHRALAKPVLPSSSSCEFRMGIGFSDVRRPVTRANPYQNWFDGADE